MNTPLATRLATRLTSLCLSVVVTIAMLGSVDHLASVQPAAEGALMAAAQGCPAPRT